MLFYSNIAIGKRFINFASIRFGLISGFTFIVCTLVFYLVYGWECLFESLLYHLTRKDHRHNFSIQFMFIYLDFIKISPLKSICFFLPSIFLIVLFTVKYKRHLVYGSFLCTYVFVAFNKSIHTITSSHNPSMHSSILHVVLPILSINPRPSRNIKKINFIFHSDKIILDLHNKYF